MPPECKVWTCDFTHSGDRRVRYGLIEELRFMPAREADEIFSYDADGTGRANSEPTN